MVNDYKQAASILGVPVQAVQATTWYIWKSLHSSTEPIPSMTFDVSQFKKLEPSNDNDMDFSLANTLFP